MEMVNLEEHAGAATKGAGGGRPEEGDDSLDINTKSHEELQHLTGFKLLSVVISLLLAVFCVALDNTSQCCIEMGSNEILY